MVAHPLVCLDPTTADQAKAAWAAANATWANVEATRAGVVVNAAVVIVALAAAVGPPIASAARRRKLFRDAMRASAASIAQAAPLFYGDMPRSPPVSDAFRDVRDTRRMISLLARREKDHLRLKRLLKMKDVLGRAARTLDEAAKDSDRREALGDAGFWNAEYSEISQEAETLLRKLP